MTNTIDMFHDTLEAAVAGMNIDERCDFFETLVSVIHRKVVDATLKYDENPENPCDKDLLIKVFGQFGTSLGNVIGCTIIMRQHVCEVEDVEENTDEMVESVRVMLTCLAELSSIIKGFPTVEDLEALIDESNTELEYWTKNIANA